MQTSVDLNYLRYFYFVAKENGFTKAAEKLGVQQPVVSRAVKILEQEFKCHLLERQRKQVLLTAEGLEVYNYCRVIFDAVENLNQQVTAKNIKSHALSLACSDSLSLGLIDSLFTVLRKQNSQLKLTHHTGSAALFLDDIEKGDIDMGIFFNVPSLPTTLVKTKLADIDFHFVVKAKLKDNKDVLDSYIATNSQSFEKAEDLPLYKKYHSHNKTSAISFISSSSITRKACVLKGQGVSILPEFMIREEMDKGALVPLHKPEKLGLYLVERQSSYRNPIKNQLVAEIRNIVSPKK